MEQKKEQKKNRNNLVLIGFMGSGKTSVGIELSYVYKRPFLDTDNMIESREGRRIREIFDVDGEDYFRQKETELLVDLSERLSNKILSVGGGTPIREVNGKLLKQIGTVIYLRIRPETVYRRLMGDNLRPLLKGANPLERISTLLDQRKEIYESIADVIIDVDELTIKEVVSAILSELK